MSRELFGIKTASRGNPPGKEKVVRNRAFWTGLVLASVSVVSACGEGGKSDGGGSSQPGAGGSATGGYATGGGGAGGTATGGGSTGGVSTGGSGTGGVGTGGADTGGAETGGASTGGETGGTGGATGGDGSGGSATGGTGGGTGGALPTCDPNTGNASDGDANIDLDTEHQNISGYGGINVPGWIDDLTAEQADTAFGNGSGQIGMSLLRVRIPYDAAEFELEVPTAVRAVSHGAKVFATPWTPPASMKSNNDIVGGSLEPASYADYANHLLSFRDFMEENGVELEAISVQNEPDIDVDYESCDWNGSQFVSFLTAHGSKFGNTKVIVAESFNFNRSMTDQILNNGAAEAQVDIIGGHIYGGGLSDYPLARNKGKEIWMTEHYTDSSANSANSWPGSLSVGKEIHDVMAANMSAYVWWYIRRSYGLLTEDGKVSKRGYLMAQYSKFVRPGFRRIGATKPSASQVYVTAYKDDAGKVVVVAVNMSGSAQNIDIDVYNGCVASFAKYTTSGSKNVANDGTVTVTDNKASVSLDAQSVTTFVSTN